MKVLSYLLLSGVMFAATSCLNQDDGQYIPGVNGPTVNIQDGKILLTIELENIEMVGGATIPLEKMPNSTVTIGPVMDPNTGLGGTMIRAAFDLKDVENDNFRIVPAQYLPDGRPFPFLVDGSLPAVAIHVPKAKDATFYVSEKVFGFFIPVKLPENFNIGVHYRIKVNGKNFGVVSLVQNDASGHGAGVVALLTLDDIRANSGAQKLLKMSKKSKNKSKLY